MAPCATWCVRRLFFWVLGVLMVAWCALIWFGTRGASEVWMAVYRGAGFPEGYEVRGIDVSHYQGHINWERLSRAMVNDGPVRFAIVKATEGVSVTDVNFEDNFRESRRHGMIRGAYHYFSPDVPASDQAEWFIRRVRLEPGDLPPVLDIEDAGDLSLEDVHDAALTWLLLVEDHYGVKPILYTNLKFKRRYLSSADFKDYPFWIAHYYVKNVGWPGQWHFWQHTDRGRLPGIRGFVDFNVYNGSMYSLRRLCVRAENF